MAFLLDIHQGITPCGDCLTRFVVCQGCAVQGVLGRYALKAVQYPRQVTHTADDFGLGVEVFEQRCLGCPTPAGVKHRVWRDGFVERIKNRLEDVFASAFINQVVALAARDDVDGRRNQALHGG